MTLLVDSFRPRGLTTVCNQGTLVPPDLRARDAFSAADYLRSLANVRGDRIGVIGFSHGGWTVLRAVLSSAATRPFAAAVAFYPWCGPPNTVLKTDTLILIGEADDWTPAERCVQWRDRVQANGRTVQLKTYPEALHGFDSPRPQRIYAGHQVGGHPTAGPDAIAETQAFFAERLLR